MKDSELKTVLESLKATRIYIGADFERAYNEKKYGEALFLQTIRDNLATTIQNLESYKAIKGEIK